MHIVGKSESKGAGATRYPHGEPELFVREQKPMAWRQGVQSEIPSTPQPDGPTAAMDPKQPTGPASEPRAYCSSCF